MKVVLSIVGFVHTMFLCLLLLHTQCICKMIGGSGFRACKHNVSVQVMCSVYSAFIHKVSVSWRWFCLLRFHTQSICIIDSSSAYRGCMHVQTISVSWKVVLAIAIVYTKFLYNRK